MKLSKKQKALFNKEISKYIETVYSPEKIDVYRYKLQTDNYGLINIALYDDQAAIYSRFEDPKKALREYSCNPYNGKFNRYFDCEVFSSVDELINTSKVWIDYLLKCA